MFFQIKAIVYRKKHDRKSFFFCRLCKNDSNAIWVDENNGGNDIYQKDRFPDTMCIYINTEYWPEHSF